MSKKKIFKSIIYDMHFRVRKDVDNSGSLHSNSDMKYVYVWCIISYTNGTTDYKELGQWLNTSKNRKEAAQYIRDLQSGRKDWRRDKF